MTKQLPFGVQFARIINIITIVFNVALALILEAIAIPNYVKTAQQAGKDPHMILLTVTTLITFVVFCIPAILLTFLNRGLSRLNPMARVWQMVISCVFLFAFPIGTLLNGIILYYMFFDAATKEAFGVQ